MDLEKSLDVFKKCEAEASLAYEICQKETIDKYPGQHTLLCRNQQRLAQVFCLHDEKEKAGITSGGVRSAKTLPEPAQ